MIWYDMIYVSCRGVFAFFIGSSLKIIEDDYDRKKDKSNDIELDGEDAPIIVNAHDNKFTQKKKNLDNDEDNDNMEDAPIIRVARDDGSGWSSINAQDI